MRRMAVHASRAGAVSVLRAPLDLLLVRMIGAPQHGELAVAAVADGPQPVLVVDAQTLQMTGASQAYIVPSA